MELLDILSEREYNHKRHAIGVIMTNNIDKLKKQKDQITARLQRAENLQAQQKRKNETRIKILVGATVLNAVESGEVKKERLTELLDKYLTTQRDRKLFNLTEKPPVHDKPE